MYLGISFKCYVGQGKIDSDSVKAESNNRRHKNKASEQHFIIKEKTYTFYR